MNAGETFLVPGLDDHLWMVISDPAADGRHVVITCFLSWRSHLDQSCIVRAGEHPFVTHDTCVHYQWARVVSDADLEARRAAGQLKMKALLSQELLDRIRRCAELSDRIPLECYDVLRRQGFVP